MMRGNGMDKKNLPQKVRPFVELGFEPTSVSGSEYVGDCPLCSKVRHFYVNKDTGKFSCKGGTCGAEGNLYTFLKLWHEEQASTWTSPEIWEELASERGIPVEALKEAGVVRSGDRWYIPVRNSNGVLVNFRIYKKGAKLLALPGLELGLWNHEALLDKKLKKARVWLCEGEWDGIALRYLLESEGLDDVVIGAPGSNVFKDAWLDDLKGRDLITVYDNDTAGNQGTERAYQKCQGVVKSFQSVHWPEDLPGKFDVRDFVKAEGDVETLLAMVSNYEAEGHSADDDDDDHTPVAKASDNWPLLREGKRPSIQKTIEGYQQWLKMTQDHRDAIRVCYAVIMVAQVDGDPLWVHVAGPPGSGKTEIIMSTSSVGNVECRSTITAHSLVSGFQMAGGKDPSLIPQLIGGVFVLKDFTEVLQMPTAMKDEIYSIFRGAYDGEVQKQFGNAVHREYHGYFNMLSGVTHSIFAERGASLGERFLIYKMSLAPDHDAGEQIRGALKNTGRESRMKESLQALAKEFLEWKIEPEDVPELPDECIDRIVALAQMVSMLRASVAKDHARDKLLYRPQHEVGTRLAKQLHKLALGLALQDNLDEVDWEEVMRIVTRVALNSCTAWNLDALHALAKKDGQHKKDIAEQADMPESTLGAQLEELHLLGVLRKEYTPNRSGKGAPEVRYWISNIFRKHWENSGLPICRLPKPKEFPTGKITRGIPKPTIRKKK